MNALEIQRRAQRKLAGIEKRRRDPRYRRVLGRFVQEGYLFTTEPVEKHTEPLDVEHVLWAAEVEPRFLELLPALLVKRPSLFLASSKIPEDLEQALRRLRRNAVPEPFRGIPGQDVYRWLTRVGRQKTAPARLKSFRLKPDDLRLLSALSKELGVTETEVVRRGLRALLHVK